MSLNIIECEGCGACCRHIGAPPGFFSGFCDPVTPAFWRQQAEPSGPVHDDLTIWDAMPEDVKDTLRPYYDAVDKGQAEDREEASLPCLWYDEASRSCRHYEHRPSICREFEVGCDECREFRETHGIGSEASP